MKLPRLIPLTGTIDGSNKDFFVPAGFLPVVSGSETVFLRGLPRRKDWDDGWTVIDYPTGHIEMKEAPLTGDDLELLFLQEVADTPAQEVTPIQGTIDLADELCGLAEQPGVTACFTDESELTSGISSLSLSGCLQTEFSICGKVEDC